MIEQGAYQLKEAIVAASKVSNDGKTKAQALYRAILDQAFEWQRTGYVRKMQREREAWKKIPFEKRAKPGESEAILEILKTEEKKAASRGEYEQAIKWRDARYKLKQGLDIYDTIHIVDQMRMEGKLGDYKKLTKKYRERYEKLVPGQPE